MNDYKYKPEDFKGKSGLAEDLAEFYRLLEIYKSDKNAINKVRLKNQQEDLFFSCKHRVLEGHISEELWDEINEYTGGLIDD